ALDDHDVARLEVAMDDVEAVDGIERGGELPREPRRAPRRERSVLEDLMERPSLDVLEAKEIAAVGELAEIRRGRDVRVLDVRARDRLALEALDELREVFRLRVKDLDRDALLQQQVLGAVDGAHPAHRDELADPIPIR